MLTKTGKELFLLGTGFEEDTLARLSAGTEKLFNHVSDMSMYQIVAEVVKSEHCFAQIKVGDKLIFNPFLNPQASTSPMCPEALLPILVRILGLWEMLAEWAESGKDALPEIIFRQIRCLDPGLEDGGVGCVVYRLGVENIPGAK